MGEGLAQNHKECGCDWLKTVGVIGWRMWFSNSKAQC